MTQHQTDPQYDLPAAPKPIRMLVILISVLLGLSALPGLFLSLNTFGGFAWGWFGFEFVTLLAAIFGVLIGLGKFRNGFGLALACIAGAVLVALVFGIHVDARTKIGDNFTYNPWVDRMIVLRAFVVLSYVFCAAIAVFNRNSKSWGAAIKGIACLLPVAAIGAAYMKFGLPFADDGSDQPNALRVIFVLAVGLLMIILISAGGHLLIRAFEIGRPATDAEDPSQDAKTAS